MGARMASAERSELAQRKPWRRRQSGANPSRWPGSLSSGEDTGNAAPVSCALELGNTRVSPGREAPYSLGVTIQDLGSIGELVAAVATIVTLGYLAVQIRQSAQLVSSSAPAAPGGCAAALKTLEILESDRVVEHAAMFGEIAAPILKSLEKYPIVRQARSLGLLMGVSFPPPGGRNGPLDVARGA